MLSRRCRTKKHRLQEGGTLIIRDTQDLGAIRSGAIQVEEVLPGNTSRTKSGRASRRHCTLYSKHGHNVRTCENREEGPEDSDSNNS
jgi:hypothetical protein